MGPPGRRLVAEVSAPRYQPWRPIAVDQQDRGEPASPPLPQNDDPVPFLHFIYLALKAAQPALGNPGVPEAIRLPVLAILQLCQWLPVADKRIRLAPKIDAEVTSSWANAPAPHAR